jgi:hypothetical protein
MWASDQEGPKNRDPLGRYLTKPGTEPKPMRNARRTRGEMNRSDAGESKVLRLLGMENAGSAEP